MRCLPLALVVSAAAGTACCWSTWWSNDLSRQLGHSRCRIGRRLAVSEEGALAEDANVQWERGRCLSLTQTERDAAGAALLDRLTRGELRHKAAVDGCFAKELLGLPRLCPLSRSALYASPLLNETSQLTFPRFGRCTLADEAYRLESELLEEQLRALLLAVPKAARRVGFNVTLSRFDLCHGHLFQREDGGLGILLHAAEYPAFDADDFPIHLGFCQVNSTMPYEARRMRWRNIVVLLPRYGHPRAFALDAAVAPVCSLIPEYAREPLYTLFEATLGTPVADVFFLPNESIPLGWLPRGHIAFGGELPN
mmetsp:Transcript_70583/g.181998  ORF Transcript_70583/g.181998 Transcript_70583/m.181998 type:complete len:310 (+) Transcript_70583:61-990(+)